MELRELTADDEQGLATYVDISEACRLADVPWWPSLLLSRMPVVVEHGWDGEPGRLFLVVAGGTEVGVVAFHLNTHDNLDLAGLEVSIHPDHRRRGLGREAFGLACEELRAMGIAKVAWYGWEGEQTEGFARALGFEPKSLVVCRRQHVRELEPGLADRLYDEALAHADGYVLERIAGPSPDDLLPALAEATAAINDAPLDDLEIDDEVFTADRVRAYERTQELLGFRLYRIIARRAGSGEIAGLTVVTVDAEQPTYGHQEDTSVVSAHRGHRLGLLLKADMVRWLAEAEPQLEHIDTFNADSNAHMVAVNERLGYRVMRRELQYQDRIAG